MGMGLYLSKYPVTSRSGREYYVTERTDSIGFLDVMVYVKTTGLFGRTKFKRVYGDGLREGVFRASEWDYDYIAIAKRAVSDYEEKNIESLRKQHAHLMGIEAFEKWDGK